MKLFKKAWPLVRRSILLRIEAADSRYSTDGAATRRGKAAKSTLVVPYFVPNFNEDEAIDAASKQHTVCFFGSATNSVRKSTLDST